jgi:hypothetical protein
MLLACDELLRLRGDATDWDWEQIVENNIGFHWDFIKSPALNSATFSALDSEIGSKQ